MNLMARRTSHNGAVSWAIAAFVFAVTAGLFFVRADYMFSFVVGGILALLAVGLAFRSITLFRRGNPVDRES